MKNEVRDDAELRAAFAAEDAAEIARSLRASERGRRFIAERVEPYQREFGWHAVWSHEFIFPTVREQMEPVLELIRGYLATDYDFPTAIEAMRRDIEAAVAGDPRRPDRRGARGDAGRQRGQPADGAADARPPLLHRPGRERPPAPRAAGRRPEARRGRPARPAGRRHVPALQRAPRPHRQRRRDRRPGDRGRAAGASARPPRSSSRATGSAPSRRRSSPSRTSSTGATRSASTSGSRTTSGDHRHRGVAGRRRGHRPGRPHGRRVRRGPRRRHPGLPDDQPGLGRPLHEDRRRS